MGWVPVDAGPPSSSDSAPDSAAPVPCGGDELACNGSNLCDPGVWDFDQGVPPGWDGNAMVGSRIRSGSGSMAFKIFNGPFGTDAYTRYAFCGRGNTQTMFPGVDVRGRTFVGWVNLEVSSGTFVGGTCAVSGGGGGAAFRSVDIPVWPDRWTEIRYRFGADDINASNAWSMSLSCHFPEGNALEGWVHLDDVAIR